MTVVAQVGLLAVGIALFCIQPPVPYKIPTSLQEYQQRLWAFAKTSTRNEFMHAILVNHSYLFFYFTLGCLFMIAVHNEHCTNKNKMWIYGSLLIVVQTLISLFVSSVRTPKDVTSSTPLFPLLLALVFVFFAYKLCRVVMEEEETPVQQRNQAPRARGRR